MAKQFGYNLLTFLYLPEQQRGVAKLVLKKKTCKMIVKIYQKNKKLQISDKVKAISNFLSTNMVSKISLSIDTEITSANNYDSNLLEEIAFIMIEQWHLFLEWIKKITNGLIIVATKILKVGCDWVGDSSFFSNLVSSYCFNHKEMGMNTIIFNNGLSYVQDGINYHVLGVSKIILTPKLWQEIKPLSNVLMITNYLKNERIFCYLSLEPNANTILNYAFDTFAILIFNNKNFIDEAFIKFKNGVMLEFKACIHEQFQLQQIVPMPINGICKI